MVLLNEHIHIALVFSAFILSPDIVSTFCKMSSVTLMDFYFHLRTATYHLHIDLFYIPDHLLLFHVYHYYFLPFPNFLTHKIKIYGEIG